MLWTGKGRGKPCACPNGSRESRAKEKGSRAQGVEGSRVKKKRILGKNQGSRVLGQALRLPGMEKINQARRPEQVLYTVV